MEAITQGYVKSCELVKARISELTAQKNQLSREGRCSEIKQLDLERRIHLLYVEHEDMQEVIRCLNSYHRRRQEIAKT